MYNISLVTVTKSRTKAHTRQATQHYGGRASRARESAREGEGERWRKSAPDWRRQAYDKDSWTAEWKHFKWLNITSSDNTNLVGVFCSYRSVHWNAHSRREYIHLFSLACWTYFLYFLFLFSFASTWLWENVSRSASEVVKSQSLIIFRKSFVWCSGLIFTRQLINSVSVCLRFRCARQSILCRLWYE